MSTPPPSTTTIGGMNSGNNDDGNDNTTFTQQRTDDEKPIYHVLILGASYGSLLASKLVLAGHKCTLICRSGTAKIFNENGSVIRMPVRGKDGLLDVVVAGGRLRACTPDEVLISSSSTTNGNENDDEIYHLVILAMQEPQYSAPDVRRLVLRVAAARLPVMAVTNMPLPPYLERIPILRGISQRKQQQDSSEVVQDIRSCYTDPELWDAFIDIPSTNNTDDVGNVMNHEVVDIFTQCSPDPQAFRPPNEPPNVLQVRLPTNFKAAAFGSGSTNTRTSLYNGMMKQLEQDIQSIRYSSEMLELPVKLKFHDSIFVPLAKWAMLLAGNYRCIPSVVGDDAVIISIADAVGSDVGTSRTVYEWVNDLVVTMGGIAQSDLVPFEKYLAATKSLQSPSSAARAIQNGAITIERVDKVVQTIGQKMGKQLDTIDTIVQNVDRWLVYNVNKTQKKTSEE